MADAEAIQHVEKANPFQVYPVASLQDISGDILRYTVTTGEVAIADAAVERFVEQFADEPATVPLPETREPLVLAISGDYGSGKTHLLLYTRALLLDKRPRALTLLLSASEAGYDQWYARVVGPALRALDPSRLLTEVLAKVAAQVARAVPLTEPLAGVLSDPDKVYTVLRDGFLNVTEVQTRFLKLIDALCPEDSPELRRVLAALPFEPTRRLSLMWLSGTPLDEDGRSALGIARDMVVRTEAPSALAALTAICVLLNRPFGLCIDEFEQLAAFNPSGGSSQPADRSNIEWIKKLVEAIALRGGAVVIAGHTGAWDQRGDFLDRVLRQPLIVMKVWKADELKRFVKAADQLWAERWLPASFDTLAEQCGGNIRRVITVLWEVFARTKDTQGEIDPATVRQASQRRLRRIGRESDLLDDIARAAEGMGAEAIRNARVAEGIAFDMLLKQNDEVRLVVEAKIVRDLRHLLKSGREFAEQVEILRRKMSSDVRGLLVVYGAVENNFIEQLDRYPSLTVLNGEGADVLSPAVEAVTKQLAQPLVRLSAVEVRTAGETDQRISSAVLDLQAEVQRSQQAVRERVASAFPEQEGTSSPLAMVGLDPQKGTEEEADLQRSRILKEFRERADQGVNVINVVAKEPAGVLIFVGIFAGIAFGLLYALYNVLRPVELLAVAAVSAVAFLSAAIALFLRAERLRRYHRFGANTIEELYFRGFTTADLVRAKTILDAQPSGHHGAIERVVAALERELGFRRGALASEARL